MSDSGLGLRVSGSAAEVQTALRLAAAWGDLDARAATPAFNCLDRILAMLHRLTR